MHVRKSLHTPVRLAFYSGAISMLIDWSSVETYKASTQIIIIIIIIIIIVVVVVVVVVTVPKLMVCFHIHFPMHASS